MEILFALVFMVRFGGVLVKIHASPVVGGQGDREQIRFHRIQIHYLYMEMALDRKRPVSHFSMSLLVYGSANKDYNSLCNRINESDLLGVILTGANLNPKRLLHKYESDSFP